MGERQGRKCHQVAHCISSQERRIWSCGPCAIISSWLDLVVIFPLPYLRHGHGYKLELNEAGVGCTALTKECKRVAHRWVTGEAKDVVVEVGFYSWAVWVWIKGR